MLRVLIQSLANKEHLDMNTLCYDWCYMFNKEASEGSIKTYDVSKLGQVEGKLKQIVSVAGKY